MVIFIGYVGYSMTLPVFTGMLLDKTHPILPTSYTLGQRTTLLGFLLFAYPAGQFIGSPILGALSDHFGRRPILLLSMCATTCFYLLIAFSIAEGLLLLVFCSLFLAGLCEGNISIAQSFIADTVSGKDRTVAFGHIYSAAAISYIVGPLLAGQLSRFSYSLPFLIIPFLLVTCIIWVRLSMQDRREPRSGPLDWAGAFSSIRTLFTHKRLRRYFLLAFTFYLGVWGYFSGFPIYATARFGLHPADLSLYISYIALLIFLTNLLVIPRLPEKMSMVGMTAITALLTGLSMWVIPLPNVAAAFWVTLLPTSVAIALNQTGSVAVISNRASKHEQGRVMGANQSLLAASEATAASLAGMLAAIALPLPLYLFGALAIAGGAFLLATGRKSDYRPTS